MRQVAVHLNAPITTTLRADNLGGEWRWERQVLEALLQSDAFDKVYSLEPAWKSPEPMPSKFVDGLPTSEKANTICLMHDSYHIAEKHHFAGLVIQVHQPTVSCAKFVAEYGKKFFMTYDRAIRTFDDGVHARLVERSGGPPGENGNVENIANPCVPAVHRSINNGCNFDENIILFPAKAPVLPRDVVAALSNPSVHWGELFPWCASKLTVDHKKELHFLTGYQQADLDFIGCKDMRESFFDSPLTKCLLPASDRVILHPALSWSAVLDLYARTKVVVSTLSTGGSPPEAASFGIPVIGPASSPIGQFPEFLVAECLSPEYLAITDRLYSDREFYTRIGNAYRNHINKHFTYAAYVKNLTRIFGERGMLS